MIMCICLAVGCEGKEASQQGAFSPLVENNRDGKKQKME